MEEIIKWEEKKELHFSSDLSIFYPIRIYFLSRRIQNSALKKIAKQKTCQTHLLHLTVIILAGWSLITSYARMKEIGLCG